MKATSGPHKSEEPRNGSLNNCLLCLPSCSLTYTAINHNAQPNITPLSFFDTDTPALLTLTNPCAPTCDWFSWPWLRLNIYSKLVLCLVKLITHVHQWKGPTAVFFKGSLLCLIRGVFWFDIQFIVRHKMNRFDIKKKSLCTRISRNAENLFCLHLYLLHKCTVFNWKWQSYSIYNL